MPPGMMPPSMPGPPSADQLKPGPTVTLPATLKVSGVAAIVNGEKITNQELVTRFLESGGAPTLQELITETEIGQAAHKAHVAVTETEVTNLLSQTKVQLLERSPGQTWTEFLESHGLTEDYARDQMRMQLTVEKLAVAKLPPYTLSGKIHVYHILLATTSLPYATSSHTDADALAQIKTIKSEIDAGKMTFQNAAKEYSEDHSNSSKGGDLGWISESDPLDPAFKQAAFALKQGQVSDPVKSQFGWHLIYLAKMGENATAAEVQQAADDSLQQRSQPYIGAVVQQIQANAAVEGVLMPTPPKPKPPMPVMMPRSMPVQPMHSPSGKPSRSTPPPPPM